LTPRPPGLRVRLLRGFSVVVGAAGLACGARAIRIQLPLFEGPPHRATHPAFDGEFRAVLERLPEGACVLHLSATPEYWYSRLWQRALYPRNETIVVEPPLSRESVRSLRERYGARFAISTGNPPWDPGYLWTVDLGHLPLDAGRSVFGELAP
jgi:hypothetical protein